MILETERLLLRPWQPEDAESLYEYAKDSDVGSAAGWQVHKSIEESKQVIKTVLSAPETYAVCLKTDGKAIGSIGLKLGDDTDMTDRKDECELGYWIGKAFWGQGLIPEAVREILRRAFEDLSMTAVWCGFYDGNEKSKRVQEKCGFVYQFTSYDVEVAQMGEHRTGHVSLLTKDWWERRLVVRSVKQTEKNKCMELALSVLSQVCRPDGKEECIREHRRAWSDKSFLEGLDVYAAFSSDQMVGMLSARDDLICQLFVKPEYMNKGIGSMLFQRLISDRVGRDLRVDSTECSRAFFHTLGFEPFGEKQEKCGLTLTPMVFIA